MSFHGNVNGRSIRADKAGGVQVIGDMIWFADGSTVNMTTLEIINRGPGAILVDGVPSERQGGVPTAAPDITRTLDFTGVTSVVATVDAALTIREGTDTRVVVSGAPQAVEAFERKVHVSGGQLALPDVGPLADVQVTLPETADVVVRAGVAPLHIDSRPARVTVTATGAADVTIGRVNDLNVTLTGAGRVRVEHINGDAVLQVRGAGQLDVADGVIANLNVQTSGAGQVRVGGVTDAANLSASGAAQIMVARVRRPPLVAESGVARVNVAQVG